MKTVPKELQEQVIDLYVNKQYGINRVWESLNRQVSQNQIKQIVQDNGYHLRSLKEASKIVGERHKINVEEATKDKIVQLYQEGYGQDTIVRLLNLPFSFETVKNILREKGVHIRNIQEAHNEGKIDWNRRKIDINDDYNFESHNGAWLVGFFAADGYMPNSRGAKNRVTITLARKDEDCLKMIKDELDYKGNIHQYITSNGFPSSGLAFTSQKIRHTLESYGVVHNKTYIAEHLPQNIPEEYMIDYIRGFFDGDGSIWVNKNKYGGKVGMSFTCYSKTFLEEISSFLHEKYGLKKKTLRPDHNNWSIVYCKKESFILGDLFYNNNYLALPRKKKKFFKLKEEYPVLKKSCYRR